MLIKSISLILLAAASTTFACEMDCRRGVSRNFADAYAPVIKDSIDNLHAQLTKSINKVAIPSVITAKIEKTELQDDIEDSIDASLTEFISFATSEKKLAEGFYQVTFNEELPYKGDCNNPKRLERKMPPKGESWTMDECKFLKIKGDNERREIKILHVAR